MRCATLALVLYLALDFANPLMPGSVSFDPDESVHATRAGSIRDHQDLVVAPSIDWAHHDLGGGPGQPSVRLSRAHRVARRSTPARLLLLRLPESAPAPASDDH